MDRVVPLVPVIDFFVPGFGGEGEYMDLAVE